MQEYTECRRFLVIPLGNDCFGCLHYANTGNRRNNYAIDDKTQRSFFKDYPQVPWAKVIGLRNIISHEYANIDYEIIWVVITKHLPPLKETVENIIKDLS